MFFKLLGETEAKELCIMTLNFLKLDYLKTTYPEVMAISISFQDDEEPEKLGVFPEINYKGSIIRTL